VRSDVNNSFVLSRSPAPGRSGCIVRANMATITDHRISNSQHKTGVSGHFSDGGKRTPDNILKHD